MAVLWRVVRLNMTAIQANEPGVPSESSGDEEEDLVCRALLLAWVVTQIDDAWHAGEIDADSAMSGINNVVQRFVASRESDHFGLSISEFDYLSDLRYEVPDVRPAAEDRSSGVPGQNLLLG
jgi:hypothetical protein